MSKKEELEDRLSRVSSELSMWRGLVNTAGWGNLKKTMEMQRNTRLLTVGAQPLTSFSQVMPQEFMKGEANGIGLTLMFPLTQIELLQAEVTSITTLIEQEIENVQEAGTPDELGSRVDSQHWFGSNDSPGS